MLTISVSVHQDGRVQCVTFDGFISWDVASKYNNISPAMIDTKCAMTEWRPGGRAGAVYIYLFIVYRGRRLVRGREWLRRGRVRGRGEAASCVSRPIRPLASAINTEIQQPRSEAASYSETSGDNHRDQPRNTRPPPGSRS